MDSLDDKLPAPIRPSVAAMPPSGIHEVFKLGYGREGLIPLWVGEGDQATPDFISDAADAALRAGKTFYNPKRGVPELRDTIARYETRLHGKPVDMERITVTSSAMTGIVVLMDLLLDPGDEIVVVTPVWPNITAAIEIANCKMKPVVLEPLPEGGFRLDHGQLEAAMGPHTKALFISSPSNPSGWITTAAEQREILDLCRKHGIWLIADEVYIRFDFLPRGDPSAGTKAPSYLDIAEPDDPLIVINSFSKAWAMTGWRMGWLVHPAALGNRLETLIEFVTSGAPHFLQYGCIAALEQGEAFVAEQVERCRQGGEIVYQGLGSLPRVRMARPQGTFYVFFGLDGMEDSMATAKELLEKTNVGLAPGSAFGPGGEGHLRLCFAASHARLSEAIERLRPALS